MNASGSRRARMATYSAVQGPIPGSATSEARNSEGSVPGSMTTVPLSTASASATRARRRLPGMEKVAGSSSGQRDQRVRGGEEVGDPSDGLGERLARQPYQPPGNRAGPRHGDLLADDGAHRELEPVDGSGHTPPGSAATRGPISGSGRSASRMATGSASRSSSWRQRDTAVVRSRRSERWRSASTKAGPSSPAIGRGEGDHGVPVRQAQAAPVGGTVTRFDPGHGASCRGSPAPTRG